MKENPKRPIFSFRELAPGFFWILLLLSTRFYNYLFFHVLTEWFTVAVAVGIFLLAWHSRNFIQNGYILVLGIAYFFVAMLDLFHTLAYQGMGVLMTPAESARDSLGANMSIQFWIAGRYLESLSLFIAPFFLKKRLSGLLVFALYALITVFVGASIMVWHIFPTCFIHEQGLTPFKVISEYVVAFILALSIAHLWFHRREFQPHILVWLILAASLTIISEAAFTLYNDMFGIFNVIGHCLKIASFYLIYKAVVETGFTEPHSLLYYDLKQSEERLREAKEAAEAANRAKSDFLAMMSHEIRTPMNAILGILGILIRNPQNPRLREFLGTTRDSAQSLLNILNDILDISKAEAGKLEIEKVDFEVRPWFDRLGKTLAVLADEKQLTFEYKVDPAVPSVLKADPSRLSQILLNLAWNALKFTEEGACRLSITPLDPPSPSESHSVALRFEVQDTGIGISQEQMEKIFESFSQAEASTTRRFGGTGLGLTVSRLLVEQMGGEICVESEMGKGSRFYFDLVVEKGQTPQKQYGQGTEQLTKAATPRHILLVEDNPVNQMVAQLILEELGHQVEVVDSGQACLERLEKEPHPQLILMDVEMPGMDGMEATDRIRHHADAHFPREIPIIALTAHALKGSRETFLKAGMNHYISKPIDIRQMQAAIQETLGD